MPRPAIALFFLVLWLALPNAMAAAGLPDYFPESFERWGVINEVYAHERVLVIDGVRVPVKPTLQVLTPRTRFENVDDLRPTMKVGFDGGRSSEDPVSKIWVLPPEHVPQGAERVGEAGRE